MSDASASLGVVILAAGKGTRMRSERAKVLHAVAGKSLVGFVLDTAVAVRPDRLAVVVGHEATEVERVCAAHLASRAPGVPAVFPLQEQQRGTGDAVRVALPALDGLAGDVVILYGDVPALRAETLSGLLDHHRASGATLSMLTTRVADPTGYGRIKRDAAGRVAAIVEQRDLALEDEGIDEINPGIYCVRSDFLPGALGRLRADNAQEEYYLTDIVGLAVADGAQVETVDVPDDREVAGINAREELATMEQHVRQELIAKWMREGVTFRDPATTYLEDGVTIGADTVVGPNTQLLGQTSIGRGCRIDGTVFLENATLGDRVHLKLGIVMTDCEVGSEAIIGPFAQIRPGSVLGERVHIGNFVETKKARLGTGTKANHLTYLGDVEIGEATNVGAGTITCNYDGFDKHQTVIGDRVQIGSDTQLVAPVTVADDAYVAAGTTVTKNVPSGALALSRSQQQVVPGWVERRRARAAASGGERKRASGGQRGKG